MVHVTLIVGGFELRVDALATRLDGAKGRVAVGLTTFEGFDGTLVPIAFVAVTVNV